MIIFDYPECIDFIVVHLHGHAPNRIKHRNKMYNFYSSGINGGYIYTLE